MKKLAFLIVILFSNQLLQAQFIDDLYKDFLKYGTFYAAGKAKNSYQQPRKDYFLARPSQDDLYSGKDRVIDVTPYYDFDYTISIGIRKLARFDYEIKATNFYDGTENNIGLSAPTSAFKGLEYLLNWEKERQRGEIFMNTRYFIRHTGKYHIAKLEHREQGNIGFRYESAELRARLPIGSKFSISAGAIYRTHQEAFGYVPIELWLNEEVVDEYSGENVPKNIWYTLGFDYGYEDVFYTQTSIDPFTLEEVVTDDWRWVDKEGNQVASSDLGFRQGVYKDLVKRFNNEQWDLLDTFGEISPIVGFDFYHYSKKFWLHTYGSYYLPFHQYIRGDEEFSYLNRNNWGKGGLRKDANLEQWDDYQFGVILGWKLTQNIGVFAEGEYNKMWDREFFTSNVGINFTFK